MTEDATGIHCRLDELLADRGMTLARLSQVVGVSVVNLSVLKNDRARAVRFSTLHAVCAALGCEPGDLLVLDRSEAPPPPLGGPSQSAQRARSVRAPT